MGEEVSPDRFGFEISPGDSWSHNEFLSFQIMNYSRVSDIVLIYVNVVIFSTFMKSFVAWGSEYRLTLSFKVSSSPNTDHFMTLPYCAIAT